MNNEIITETHTKIKSIFQLLSESEKDLTSLEENTKPDIYGETFLTDAQLAEKLHISRRTLQEYRNNFKISYIQLPGKILYRSSDVEKMLNEHYHPSLSY